MSAHAIRLRPRFLAWYKATSARLISMETLSPGCHRAAPTEQVMSSGLQPAVARVCLRHPTGSSRGERRRTRLLRSARESLRAVAGSPGSGAVLEDLVASGMPPHVVDALEVIDVNHGDDKGPLGCRRLSHRGVQYPVQSAAIGDARQRVDLACLLYTSDAADE